jgi:16S rRNA U1498 N3-methylase RsmE
MSRFIYNLSVNKDSHIITCNEFNYIKNILQLTPNDNININCSLTDLIFTNAKIIDKSRHWSLLLYQWDKSLERTFNI